MRRRPDSRQLVQFAAVLPIAVLVVCWALALTWLQLWVALASSLVLAVIGWRYPTVLLPLFVSLSIIAAPVGWAVGELVLLSVYFGIITPLGLFFRLLQRDPLERKIDRNAKSYWQTKSQPQHPSRYLRRW